MEKKVFKIRLKKGHTVQVLSGKYKCNTVEILNVHPSEI